MPYACTASLLRRTSARSRRSGDIDRETVIDYHAMRMAWCRTALWAFVRRWGVNLTVGIAVLVIGMPGGPANTAVTAQALCAWLVLPLFRAAGDPVWAAPATALQALAGAGLLWGMRPLLWPARWAAAERALPLARRSTLWSDCRVVPLGLLPLAVPCLIGARALVASHPAWLRPGPALLALGVAVCGSAALGVAMLQGLRRPHAMARGRRAATGSPGVDQPRSDRRVPTAVLPIISADWPRVILVLPLWRGPAKRSGILFSFAAVLACLPALGVWRWPSVAAWWLAAYAAGAMVAVTRAKSLLQQELAPLLAASATLPISPRRLRRGVEALAVAPLAVSGPLLIAACLAQAHVRPAVLMGYAIAGLGSCLIEVGSTTTDLAGKSGRWLFCLALAFAFASEVMA